MSFGKIPTTEEYCYGRRMDYWDEVTNVKFNITATPRTPLVLMSNNDAPFELIKEEVQIDYYAELHKALQNGEVEVQFQKADGSWRTMNCTLKTDLIPNHKNSAIHESQNKDPNLIKVYSTDRAGWRSFRFERLLKFTPIKG